MVIMSIFSKMRPATILMQPVSHKLQQLIHAELHPFERIVWSSAPRPARLARRTLPTVLFGIPWTAFAIFWIAGASGFKMPDFSHGAGLFPLFGVPFVLIGFGMLSSPYWAARKAAPSAYVVTNERVIIFESGVFGAVTIRSFLPHQLAEIRRVQLPNGSGDLILDKEVTTDSEGSRSTTDIGFFGIPDVKGVEMMVLALARLISSEEKAQQAVAPDRRDR